MKIPNANISIEIPVILSIAKPLVTINQPAGIDNSTPRKCVRAFPTSMLLRFNVAAFCVGVSILCFYLLLQTNFYFYERQKFFIKIGQISVLWTFFVEQKGEICFRGVN